MFPEEFEELSEAAANTAKALMVRFKSGEITASEWRSRMEATIKRLYEGVFSISGLSLLDEEADYLREKIQFQLERLDAFEEDLEEKEFDERWFSRAGLYILSAYAVYVYADIYRSHKFSIPLPAYPGEGTVCLTNCKCVWDIDPINPTNGDYDAYWKLGAVEHCSTCVTRNALWSPVRIRGWELQV